MLEKVIKQLPDEKYGMFYDELIRNKGEKTVGLLEFYRKNPVNIDEVAIEVLNLNHSSYYTLRSRLLVKLQEFLFKNPNEFTSNLLNHVYCVPAIVVNYPRETSISILKHLEQELKNSDLPEYLLTVYHALKKLHSNSEKFYTYDQLYNKCVAYTLAHNKAEEILNLQCKHQNAYMLSGDENYVPLMLVCMQELFNLTELYESAKINFLFKLSFLNYSIFTDPNFNRYFQEQTIDEIIQDCRKHISSLNMDEKSGFGICIQFLSFQHHHSYGLNKSNSTTLTNLTGDPLTLSNIYNITTPYRFLISLLEMIVQEPEKIAEASHFIHLFTEPEEESEAEYIWYHLAQTVVHYYLDNTSGTLTKIQKLINFPALKKYRKIDIEVKLLYAFLLLLENKPDLAESILRNVNRNKNKESDPERKKLFVQILNTALNSKTKNKSKKIFEAFRIYNLLTSNPNPFLSYIKLHERHILELGMK